MSDSGQRARAVSDAIVAKLRSRKGWPPLSPQEPWLPGLDAEIAALKVEELADGRPEGPQSALAWKAALHLWNDSLDPAHELVQDLATPTGSALHGILHRREGDYGNAKYWFHQAGGHAAYRDLQARAVEALAGLDEASYPVGAATADTLRAIVAQGAWNPNLFVDAVAKQESRLGMDEQSTKEVLERLQQLELEAMLGELGGRLGMA